MQTNEVVGEDFRSFMVMAARLVLVAEGLSSPEHVYSEFWRRWESLAFGPEGHTDVWILGRRAAKSVLRDLRRSL